MRGARRAWRMDAVWHVGLVHAPIARFLEPDFAPPIAWLPPPPAHLYYADPCAVETEHGWVVCAEAYDYARRRGHLVALSGARPGRTVLRAKHHVSFPSLLRVRHEVFCVPEQGATGRTVLYRAQPAVTRFEPDTVLLERFGAADPMLFEHEGRFWLFALDHAALPAHELHVFVAERVRGPYRAHARNPVRVDVSACRPAGAPFVHGGRLYRPVQDARTRHGGALALLEITRLDDERIEERVVRRIEPWDPRYSLGVHTLCAAGDVTYVDGLRASFVPPIARAISGLLGGTR